MCTSEGCGDGTVKRTACARRVLFTRLFIALLVSAVCGVAGAARSAGVSEVTAYALEQFGQPPAVPLGPLNSDVFGAVDRLLAHSLDPSDDAAKEAAILRNVRDSADPRIAWLIADIMRFSWRKDYYAALAETARALLDIEFESVFVRDEITDHLIAWKVPAYPDYLAHKRAVFTRYVQGWDDLFVAGDIDWQFVSWGGVNIDNRPYGETDEPCTCIPAVDNPAVSTAAEADWLDTDDIVFGVSVNGEHRAYPRRIMEVREMVNDTLGGRHLGIPYCSLCGAAQAYFTDTMPEGVERPVLRTSGLLLRSNKVMFDVNTNSLFDTFKGKAVTGPLAEARVALTPVRVVTTDWGSWRDAHPDTTVLKEELALGRDYDLRNTRDARGPIFSIGDVDPRLPTLEDVIGAFAPDGTPVAFPRIAAYLALKNGEPVKLGGVQLQLDAGGVLAVDAEGADLVSHQAYWFAWSQFYPGSLLWSR
ncbi:MAG: DUF3179 domain-containing (seleno)protein [Pseudomonadota bacterium]